MSIAAQSIGYEAALKHLPAGVGVEQHLIEAAKARHSRLYSAKEPQLVSRVRSIPVRPPAPKPTALPMVRMPVPEPEPVKRDVLIVAEPEPVESDDVLITCLEWKRIVTEVARKHDLTLPEIIGAQRSRPIVLARHEAFYRLKTETTMSLPAIGRRIGGRDHTTVMHGIKRHRSRMEEGTEKKCEFDAQFSTVADSVLLIKRPSEAKTGGH